MKLYLAGLLFLLFCNSVLGQQGKNEIEIRPYIRKDWYPEFPYAVNSIDTNHVKMRGTSWGLAAIYKIPIRNSWLLKFGSGYYRHSFNKMITNNRFGTNSRRHIKYPSMFDIPFFTDRYWYNCVMARVGAEKSFLLNKDWQVTTEVNIDNYFTFSQGYHITYDNPDNPITNPYKLEEKRFFGFSGSVSAGALKRVGSSITLGPSFILPVFDLWKQDAVFPKEDNSKTRQKWFDAFGVGLTCNYLLNTKK